MVELGDSPWDINRGLVIGWPSLMIWIFAALPLLILLVVSLSQNIEGGSWELGLGLENYQRLLEPRYLQILLYSLGVSALVAVISVTLAFPLAFFITRLSRRAQVAWLVFLLASLSLSEVLIAFAWQVMLSRNIGISQVLVWLGLLQRPVSLQPGFGAVLTALVYFVLPYTFLLFYPPLSRLDNSLLDAARTLGAGPVRVFFSVVLPMHKIPLIGSLILVFVFVLGAYVTPTQLGRPQHWTLSVHITDQATTAFNLPFAAALAMLLMLVSLLMVGFTSWLGRGEH